MSPVLPTGKVDLKFNFIKTGMLKGTGELYVNGKKVATGPIDKTVPGSFSLSETFDVGVDNGTPVSNDYKVKDHFPLHRADRQGDDPAPHAGGGSAADRRRGLDHRLRSAAAVRPWYG